MKNLSVRLFVLVGALALSLVFAPAHGADAASTRTAMIAEIDELRRATWHWQKLMGKPRTPTKYEERRTRDDDYRRWVREPLAATRTDRPSAAPRIRPTAPTGSASTATSAIRTRAGVRAPGTGTTAGCRWTSPSSAPTDASCCAARAPQTAGAAVEQMWVAERAYRSGRGFYPWPNTARSCGLI